MRPRDLNVVIGELLGVIPEDQHAIRHEVKSIQYKLPFTSPELIGMRWQQVKDVLQTLGDPSKGPKWIQDVAKIFVGK